MRPRKILWRGRAKLLWHGVRWCRALCSSSYEGSSSCQIHGGVVHSCKCHSSPRVFPLAGCIEHPPARVLGGGKPQLPIDFRGDRIPHGWCRRSDCWEPQYSCHYLVPYYSPRSSPSRPYSPNRANTWTSAIVYHREFECWSYHRSRPRSSPSNHCPRPEHSPHHHWIVFWPIDGDYVILLPLLFPLWQFFF